MLIYINGRKDIISRAIWKLVFCLAMVIQVIMKQLLKTTLKSFTTPGGIDHYWVFADVQN